MINLGQKIKLLRKQKNVSQDVFANYLGVSFQAVSKWENEKTMPDVTMLPAIASFFGVSIDELFEFNLYSVEIDVKRIVDEHSKFWDTDKNKAEQIIRDGLKKYPGNDILLNCLLGVLDVTTKSDEIISLAKALAEKTKDDEIRFDAYRIMAEAYKFKGDMQAVKDTIEHIPEIYFTKFEVAACLLDGEDGYVAAQKQINLSAQSLINLLLTSVEYLEKKGDLQKANFKLRLAQKIIDAFLENFSETNNLKTHIYEFMSVQKINVGRMLNEL